MNSWEKQPASFFWIWFPAGVISFANWFNLCEKKKIERKSCLIWKMARMLRKRMLSRRRDRLTRQLGRSRKYFYEIDSILTATKPLYCDDTCGSWYLDQKKKKWPSYVSIDDVFVEIFVVVWVSVWRTGGIFMLACGRCGGLEGSGVWWS